MAGYIKGRASVELNKIREQRRKQEDLTARIKGYEPDLLGNYRPNNLGTLKESITESHLEKRQIAMEQELILAKEYVQDSTDRNNATTMTDALTAAIGGSATDAQFEINKNPKLKAILSSKGMSGLSQVDYLEDRELLEQQGNIEIDYDRLATDPSYRNALNSTLLKVTNADGVQTIVGTAELLHESNTRRYMSPSSVQALEVRIKKLQSLMKGTILTQEDIELKEAQVSAKTSEAVLADNTITQTNNDMMDWLTANPDKTLNDYNIELLTSKNAVTAQNKIDADAIIAKAKVASDAIKATADAEAKKNKVIADAKAKKNKVIADAEAKKNKVIADAKAKVIDDALEDTKEEEKEYKKAKTKAEAQKKLTSLSKSWVIDHIKTPTVNKEFTVEELILMNKVQGKNKLTATETKDLTNSQDNVEQGINILKLLDGIKDDDYKVAQTWINKFNKLIVGGKDVGDDLANLANLKLNTRIDLLVKSYVKFISGAGVTNDERESFQESMVAGEFKTKEALVASLGTFTEVITNRHVTMVDQAFSISPISSKTFKLFTINNNLTNKAKAKEEAETETKAKSVTIGDMLRESE